MELSESDQVSIAARVTSLEHALVEAEHRAKELAERCDHLEEILRQEHAASVGLRAAQRRQLQIDVIRTLADVAAEVEELATDHFGPEVLVDRVRSIVSAHALEPIGAAGATSPFDPDLHVPAYGTPEAGTMTTVIRPGYRWCLADEDVVLSKALVTT